jgi:hypothetical protein
MRVPGQLLEAVLVMLRLGRFAETDLIGRDHAVAGLCQRRDGALPCCGTKVLAMQQRDDQPIGFRRFTSK